MSNQLRAMKLCNEKVQEFGEDVRTSGRKGYILFNGRYSAVCTAKRIENWNHGKGDCFRACSECGTGKRGNSSSLTPGSVVGVIGVVRRETWITTFIQSNGHDVPVVLQKELVALILVTDRTPSPSG